MFTELTSWLAWQEKLHPSTIDLGLDRVHEVLRRLQFKPPSCPVITIAGTKGKGSCAAMLESIYSAAGYRVGMFTSPHLLRYNERIRINQREMSDESLCVAFERIDAARGDISLTYFEFNTLAALLTFSTANLDIWILEVGMGGRLDAVNVIDADVAIVTSIGLDHTEWLGNDVESIGTEKAGIFRSNRPALFGGTEMPASIQSVADELGTPLLRAERDFGFVAKDQSWSWWMKGAIHESGYESKLDHLPMPGIAGNIQLWNASVSLAAIQLLTPHVPVNRPAIDHGLSTTTLAGRFQRIQSSKTSGVEWILDVAHNPMSAAVLALHLHSLPACSGKTIAIIGMLSDKDVPGTINALSPEITEWIAVSLAGARALPGKQLADHLHRCKVKVLNIANDVTSACVFASERAKQGDRVVVCGSFLAVGPVLNWLDQSS